MTWTVLAETATAGSNQIRLKIPVNWESGHEIVIATTGDKDSQHETEKFTLADVSADGMTLTLNGQLQYDHEGVTETFAHAPGVSVEVRAEVALLTRNIVVRGNDESQWHNTAEPCPDGFEPCKSYSSSGTRKHETKRKKMTWLGVN